MIDRRASSINLSKETLPYLYEITHSKHISKKLYVKIMNSFFKKVIYYMIKDGDRFILPHGLGSLQIVRYNYSAQCKNKNSTARKYVDFYQTKKLKEKGVDKTVTHTNKSTGGYWWRLHWHKFNNSRFRTKRLYSVKFTRPNIRPNSYNKNNPKLSVVPYFKDKGWEMYAEISKKILKK